ncbi:MAG: hypothetical protein V2A61_03905, partial [Calditrichota bacterium]
LASANMTRFMEQILKAGPFIMLGTVMLAFGVTVKYKAWIWFGALLLAAIIGLIGAGKNYKMGFSLVGLLMVGYGLIQLIRFIRAHPRRTEDYEAVR